MGNVYFDCQQQGVRTTRDEVSERTRDTDYPYNFRIEELPFQYEWHESLIQTRRWCERNLSYDVYFDHKSIAERSQIVGYYWMVYFENSQDALLFKLKWS